MSNRITFTKGGTVGQWAHNNGVYYLWVTIDDESDYTGELLLNDAEVEALTAALEVRLRELKGE